MIGYLRGRIVDRDDELIVLDVDGVGYELHCSLTTQVDAGELSEIHLWVQTQVREDALQLFGFSTQIEKRMFNSLLKVNGVGPKLALKILSAARLEELAKMIEAGDVKALSLLPKVGKKTAEQLILTLKGKLLPLIGHGHATAVSAVPLQAESAGSSARFLGRFSGPRADVLSALVNLGFRLPDVEAVVDRLPVEIDLEGGVREGLLALAALP